MRKSSLVRTGWRTAIRLPPRGFPVSTSCWALWPVNFMFVSLRMARSGWILQSSNLHSPERRPAVEIVPKELVPVLRLELIVKGLRIAIGDEHERCANRESAGKSKNALVSQR